ncbi:helix-turn-helix domain-containing protein [Sphingomonas crocodyli]|uniref:XRE family transcriptional regulator n=1 Tax=Sphingomonas crocodyli TaxID=1979270 RepID=A0A437M694_9SPHN|nr:helix-turn-helix transcriptional regulator [Sphingomonas crocodyli]RVT93167.1 XRE family transcriptional regulator [Sphingomonas crocodyli]
MIKPSNETAQLLDQLKRVYKARGIRYADVARQIGVSEMTVKRAMAGRGLSVAMLEKMAAVAEIGIFDLAQMAREHSEPLPAMSAEQAQRLTAKPILFMTTFMLARHWPVRRIREEFGLDEVEMIRVLTELDGMGVIALHPLDRVKLLRGLRADDRATLSAQRVTHFFGRVDLTDGRNAWASGIARLSRASFAKIQQKIEAIEREIMQLTEDDLPLGTGDADWYALFCAIKPVALDEMMNAAGAPGDHDAVATISAGKSII